MINETANSALYNISSGVGLINANELFKGVFLYVLVFVVVYLISVYIYRSIAWMKIAKNSHHKYPWLAWIPFANTSLRLQLGGFHWALVFLYLLPLFGWVAIYILLIVSYWRIFEGFGYPGELSLMPLADIMFPGIGTLGYLIVIGFVAWKPKKSRKK